MNKPNRMIASHSSIIGSVSVACRHMVMFRFREGNEDRLDGEGREGYLLHRVHLASNVERQQHIPSDASESKVYVRLQFFLPH